MAVTEDMSPAHEPSKVDSSSAAVPDYLASPNAVFSDHGVEWRHGKAPDYSKTRKVWEEGKQKNHAAGSLEEMVENLVKNWEVEASFKTKLSDWRTIDHEHYSFAMNGGPPQSGEHMLKVGTYNAIIAPNEYYSPNNSDFDSSHKTFKRMMPTFAWEVLEVYSGPPQVVFKWRHWGVMKNDYVGFNDKGEKIVVKAHGGSIDITGITVATVDEKVRLQTLNTYYDPLEMFRQIAPDGVANRSVMDRSVSKETALEDGATADSATPVDAMTISEQHKGPQGEHAAESAPYGRLPTSQSKPTVEAVDAFVPLQGSMKGDSPPPEQAFTFSDIERAESIVDEAAMRSAQLKTGGRPSGFIDDAKTKALKSSVGINSSTVNGIEEDRLERQGHQDASEPSDAIDAIDAHLDGSADQVHPHPKTADQEMKLEAGDAIAVPEHTEETRLTHEEKSRLSRAECPFLMNRE